MRVLCATLLLFLTLIAGTSGEEPTKQDLLQAIEKQLKSANETAGPCVVCIVVSRSDRYPKLVSASDVPGKLGSFDLSEFIKTNPKEIRLGRTLDLSDAANIADNGYACGVVIDPSGLILTPYHVIEGATKVYVHLPNGGGSYADIHAADGRYDLAVLKLITPPAKLATIKFGDVHLRSQDGKKATIYHGKLAILMANSYVTGYRIDKPSASLGSVTNVRIPQRDEMKRDTPANYYGYGPLIEHDAKLNAGIDGAALLNLDGELIGLTTASALVSDGDGGRYAFPADENFRRVVDVLRRGEEVEYGFLGVHIDNLQISGVTARNPAALAGLRAGDTITAVNDVSIRTYPELLLQVGHALAGNRVKITVLREGRARHFWVTLGKFKHSQFTLASVRPEPVMGLSVDYGSLLSQQVVDNGRVGLGGPAGVCVRELVANSPAAAAFKKLGDRPERWLITHVNGNGVNTPAEFYKETKGQKTIKLTVLDPGELNPREREVTLP